MKKLLLAAVMTCALGASARAGAPASLSAGFAEVDVTPDVAAKPVYLAGFGKGRKATRVHDPIMARAVVLANGKTKIAIASVDVVGLFREPVERIRKELPGFNYVPSPGTCGGSSPRSACGARTSSPAVSIPIT